MDKPRNADAVKYSGLSPFQLKDELIRWAREESQQKAATHQFLDAGRGNPNWVATTPREAFFLLGQFALQESKRVWDEPDLGGMPHKDGIAERMRAFLKGTPGEGSSLLARALDYGVSTLRFEARRLRARAGRRGGRRQLSRPRSHAAARRGDRASLPREVDVRRPSAAGHVRPVRRRGRHRRHVLHLRQPGREPRAQEGRHHRARHADLHALSRDAAARGVRPRRSSRSSRARWPRDGTPGSTPTPRSPSWKTRPSRRSSWSTPATRPRTRCARGPSTASSTWCAPSGRI